MICRNRLTLLFVEGTTGGPMAGHMAGHIWAPTVGAGRSSWVMTGLITQFNELITQFNELITWLSVSI